MARTLLVQFIAGASMADQIIGFRVEQPVGRPAEAWVDVQIDEYAEPEDLVASGAALTWGYAEGEMQTFDGLIESVTMIGSAAGASDTNDYRFHVVARSYLAGLNQGTEIFQEKTVKEIISKALEDNGIPSDRQEWRLTKTYPKRVYCVQYNESTLAFITRLCEQEGIWFFVEAKGEGEGDLMIFGDDSTAAADIPGNAELPYRPRGGFIELEDSVVDISETSRVVSGKFVLRDYDFEKPDLDLTKTAEADADTDLEVYDYPGLYTVPAEGERLVKVRLEAAEALRKTFGIEADCPRIVAGRKMSIGESGDIGGDGSYFITHSVHEYRHGSRRGAPRRADVESAGDEGAHYTCHAELLPIDVPFRKQLVTPRPTIEGPQTAEVMCPDGSQPEEIHTDEHGRAKVRFHWDHLGPDFNDKASCWMRVAQVQTSGSMLLPRISWEVIVEYLEGDPDKPIVTGKMYNGVHMPPYALPEGKSRTSLKTASTPGGGGSNEIRFEDKAGGEEIMIHAQHDTTMATANNKKKTVGNNESLAVKVDSTMKVGSNQDIKITKGFNNEVGGDQLIDVGAMRKVEVNAVSALNVAGSATISVGAAHFEQIGNPLEALLALAAEVAANYAAAKAAEAMGRIDAAVQARVDQVMGPVNQVTGAAQALGDGMNAVANGDLGAAGGLLAGAAGLPTPGGFASSLSGGAVGDGAPSGGTAATSAPGGGSSSAGATAQLGIDMAVNNAIQRGISGGASALGAALGLDAEGGGGASAANAAGPEGGVPGIDQSDMAKGPGHETNKITGSHTEEVGAMKIVGALNGVMTNATGSMKQNVGAARAALVLGNHASSVEGMKSQTHLGLIVVTKGNETETVSGTKMAMVGGAIAEKIAGSHSVTGGSSATFIGALHKMEAKTKMTFKVGGNEVVVDGSGITVTAPLITYLASKIQLPKAATEV